MFCKGTEPLAEKRTRALEVEAYLSRNSHSGVALFCGRGPFGRRAKISKSEAPGSETGRSKEEGGVQKLKPCTSEPSSQKQHPSIKTQNPSQAGSW